MGDAAFTAELVEYTERIKTEESIASEWQNSYSVLLRKCVVKGVKL